MSPYYPSNYYSHQQIEPLPTLLRPLIRASQAYGVFGKNVLGRLVHGRIQDIKLQCLGPIRPQKTDRILDVGSGAGTFLHQLQGLGFTNLHGIDPFLNENLPVVPGLKLQKCDIHDIHEIKDIITFHHTFEHIPDPHACLAKVRTLLAPGGWCVIRIPTVSSWAWEHYGIDWVQLDAPRHLYLHSLKSIKNLAVKHGLEMPSIIFDSTTLQFIGSEQYRMGIAHRGADSYFVDPSKSHFSRHDIANFKKQAGILNAERRGDQFVAYLRIAR
jgi:SAM-dependent methyltransferase